MKFIYVTDTHVQGSTPASRTDNYFETCLRKLREVGEIAREVSADLIFHGGDIFNTARPSFGVFNKVADEISRSGINWLFNIGNHDLFAWNPDTYDRTAAMALDNLSNVTILQEGSYQLTHWPAAVLGDKDAIVMLHARWPSIERDGDPSCLTIPPDPRIDTAHLYNIMLAHVMLVEDNFFGNHISMKNLPMVNMPDLILGSHYHPGWPTKTVQTSIGKTILASPGALLRPVKMKTRREPKVLIVDINWQEEWVVNIEHRSLQNVESWPFRQDVEAAEVENVRYTPQFGTFLEKLMGESGSLQLADPRDLVIAIGKELELPAEAVSQALVYLDTVKESRNV